MANKLKVNKKKTSSSRYFKGLSVAEMDDVEQSVEEALENPAGTFTIVTQELNFRLSNMQKSIKTIGVDTKYIRKAIDKLDKKLDKKLDDIGSGGSGFNLGDILGTGAAAHGGWGALKGLFGRGASSAAGPATAASKRAIGLKSLSNLSKLGKAAGASFGGAVNMMGPSMILDAFDDKVLAELEPKLQNSRDLRKQYGDEIFAAARKKYQPWWRWSSIDTEDSRDGEYIQSYLNDLKRTEKTTNVKRKINISAPTIINNVNSSVSNTGFKELSPTERAEIISKKLKIMTEIPNTATKQTIPEPIDAGAPVSPIQNVPNNIAPELPKTPGTLNQGTTGGGFSGGGGGGWSEDNTTTPSAVPSTSSPPSTTPQKDVIVGTGKLKGVQERMKMVYDGYRSAGFSDKQARALTAEVGRENGYNPDIMFGTHVDPHNKKVNLGMLSMQGSRGTGLYNHMKSRGLIDKDGKMIHSQESINAMAEYTRKEMETNPDYSKTKKEFLDNPNIDPEQAAGVLGRNYIRWRMDDPRYASHNIKRQNYLKDITKITSDSQFKEPEKIASASYDTPKAVGGPMPNAKDVASKVASATVTGTYAKDRPTITGDTKIVESYGPGRPGRPSKGIRDIASLAANASGMEQITYTSGVGNTISASGRARGQKFTYHSTGKALDVDGFKNNEERLKFIENAVAAGAKGVGIYKNGSVHIDTRDNYSNWNWGGQDNEAFLGAINKGKMRFASGDIPVLPKTEAKTKITDTSNIKPGRGIVDYSRHRPSTVKEKPVEAKKVIYANAEVKPPMNKSEQVKTSDTNFLEDRIKTQSAPGKGNMEPTLAEKQAKLKEEHRRYILDKNSDPKPPVQKTYDKTPFKERFPNFSTAADPNFGAKKITPENNPADVAMEMAKKALEESVKTANAAVAHDKELIKNVVATPPPKLPQSSANKPPLANLPKTAKKGVSNPTDKAPGADSAKTNTAPPLEDLLPQGGQYFP